MDGCTPDTPQNGPELVDMSRIPTADQDAGGDFESHVVEFLGHLNTTLFAPILCVFLPHKEE